MAVGSLDGVYGDGVPPSITLRTHVPHSRRRVASALLMLTLGVRHPREGEAPAEPRLRVDASPGTRLSRSFTSQMGLATGVVSLDCAIGRFALVW